jgi:hypothetical protein
MALRSSHSCGRIFAGVFRDAEIRTYAQMMPIVAGRIRGVAGMFFVVTSATNLRGEYFDDTENSNPMRR